MATRWETFPIEFTGGLITNISHLEQGLTLPGSARILQNFEPSVEGGYTRVAGYQKFSMSEVPGTGLIHGVIAINSSEALVERDGQYYHSSGGAWTSKLALVSSPIVKFRHAEYNFTGNKKSVIVDGLNTPAYFDHITKTMAYGVSAPAEVVGATSVAVFKSHIFFAKNSLLSFTSPYLEDNYNTGTGAGVINVASGDEITGLIVFRDQLIIFCLNSIYRLSGTTSSDFILSPIATNIGCMSGDTIQEVGGDILYLGPDGVRFLSATERLNDFGLNRASAKVQKAITEFMVTGGLYSSVTLSEKNQYRIFNYTSNVSSKNSKGFLATKFSDQSTEDIQWATLKGFKVYDLDKIQEAGREYLYFTSDTSYVYRMETGSSLDGENIEAIFETPYMPINDPKIRKTVYKHTLYARPAGVFSVNGQVKFDYGVAKSSTSSVFVVSGSSTSAIYGDAVYGAAVYGGIPEEQYYNNLTGSGFVIALRYSDFSQTPPYNLNFAILEYRTHERR